MNCTPFEFQLKVRTNFGSSGGKMNKVKKDFKSATGSALKTQELRVLVAELMKPHPNVSALKNLTAKAGIEFNEDTTELMSIVLQEINQTITGLVTKKRKSYETNV